MENAIRQLRQFFPKSRSLKNVSQHVIDKAVELINHRPLKKLWWRTPANVFLGLPLCPFPPPELSDFLGILG